MSIPNWVPSTFMFTVTVGLSQRMALFDFYSRKLRFIIWHYGGYGVGWRNTKTHQLWPITIQDPSLASLPGKTILYSNHKLDANVKHLSEISSESCTGLSAYSPSRHLLHPFQLITDQVFQVLVRSEINELSTDSYNCNWRLPYPTWWSTTPFQSRD